MITSYAASAESIAYSNTADKGYLPTPYQQQIHQSKYARWREDLGRRETWEETVQRLIDYYRSHCEERGTPLSDELWERLHKAILLRQDILPSMRALMTAGPALKRDEIAAYNCSYIEVKHPAAFKEAMYVLMCGVGVGFSVERRHVSKLPSVPVLHESDKVLVVEDSKYGWADGLHELIETLYDGYIPSWDVSKVRPAGAPLKTFGGRASGPEPLVSLFQHIIGLFTSAQGRQLTSKEAHSIMCKIGDVVVVGGVRRSAELSLSDSDDEEMRDAKSGEWYIGDPHFALANNSGVWNGRPDRETFDREWNALIASGSGERGFFNRTAARQKAARLGTRDPNYLFGLNPCVTADTWVMTADGPRQVSELIGKQFEAVVDGQPFSSTEDGFWLSGHKKVVRLTTTQGYALRLTPDHKVKTPNGWVPAGELRAGDQVIMHDHSGIASWEGEGTEGQGWLLGSLVGDGNFSDSMAQLKFWGKSREPMMALAVSGIHSEVGGRSDLRGHMHKNYSVAQSRKLSRLAAKFGITKDNKTVTPEVEGASSDFYAGFLRGLFDADGSVQGDRSKKGVTVRLAQSDEQLLLCVQRMLARLGILSAVYRRPEAGYKAMPNGHGGHSNYMCKAGYELVIYGGFLPLFESVIGFSDPDKQARLKAFTAAGPSRKSVKFVATVSDVVAEGHEDVYDCTVPGPHAFDANGMYVRNCGEILLRDRQLCNLSQVTVRADDTDESLREKVFLATVLGIVQSTFTNFCYLSDEWKKNCEEERLLGVGMTGVMDSPLLNTKCDPRELAERLDSLRAHVRKTCEDFAGILDINVPTAATCMKPAGNSTQLVGAFGSGLHPAWSKYLIRRNRGNKNDPVAQFLYYQGVPCEDEKFHPDTTWVFSYPMKAPDGAITRDDLTAIQQLEHWLVFAEHWTEHNPSITVNIRKDEEEEVGNWVYEHFDRMIGVSFLPFDEHTYEQAPYEAVSRKEYEKLLSEMPTSFDWSLLSVLETTDQTTGSQELSCVGGACEVT